MAAQSPPDDNQPRKRRNLTLRPQSDQEIEGAALITPADVLRAQTRWDQLAPAEAKGLLDATTD